MTGTEIVCPKCDYHNQPHRSTCKNCGEPLTAEAALKQEVVMAKRKKPLNKGIEWFLAVLGLLFGAPAILFGVLGVGFLLRLEPLSLLFLLLSAGGFYAAFSFTVIPAYSLYVYQQGHETTEGEIINSYEQEVTREEGSSFTSRYVMVDFVPEKSQDSRARRLTCKVTAGTKIWSGNRKILVHYALKDPNVMLFEDEVQNELLANLL